MKSTTKIQPTHPPILNPTTFYAGVAKYSMLGGGELLELVKKSSQVVHKFLWLLSLDGSHNGE